MSRKAGLNFSPLDEATETADESSARSRSSRRWKSREANPTVQMSLRMKEDVYDRFRQHCEIDRRTNGDMLEIMMRSYEREMNQK